MARIIGKDICLRSFISALSIKVDASIKRFHIFSDFFIRHPLLHPHHLQAIQQAQANHPRHNHLQANL